MENVNACSITPGLVEARLTYATSRDPAQRDGRFLPEILSPLVPVVSRLAASAYRRYLGGARYCDHPDAAGADAFAAYCLFYLTKRLAEGAPGLARLAGEPGATPRTAWTTTRCSAREADTCALAPPRRRRPPSSDATFSGSSGARRQRCRLTRRA